MGTLQLLDTMAIENDGLPKDMNGSGHTGDWYSMENFTHITYILQQGATAATGDQGVSFLQATTVAGGGSKAFIGLANRFSKVAGTGVYVKTAVTAGIFDLAFVDNTIHVVTVKASQLDVASGFDCIRMDVEDPSVALNFLSIQAILYGNRYPSELGNPDPKLD